MRYIDPPITAIAQPVEKMGQYTIQLMLERLRGSSGAQRKMFAPKLIIRQSTAAPRPVRGKQMTDDRLDRIGN
jgi:DNA-binding LacI/PurR family transcriptional regulator